MKKEGDNLGGAAAESSETAGASSTVNVDASASPEVEATPSVEEATKDPAGDIGNNNNRPSSSSPNAKGKEKATTQDVTPQQEASSSQSQTEPSGSVQTEMGADPAACIGRASGPPSVGTVDATSAMSQQQGLNVQASRNGPRDINLRVRWADEAVTPAAGAPSSQPSSHPPPRVASTAVEPEHSDPHSLPEIHHQHTPAPARPNFGPHDPANPAAHPPNPGMYTPTAAVHVAPSHPIPVYMNQQLPMIMAQPFPIMCGQQMPMVVQQQPGVSWCDRPYLLTHPPFIGPAVQAPAVGTGTWCYPNWRTSPFHNGTSHWRTNPPIIVGQPGAQPVFLGGQPNIILYR